MTAATASVEYQIRNVRSVKFITVHDAVETLSGNATLRTSRAPQGRLHQGVACWGDMKVRSQKEEGRSKKAASGRNRAGACRPVCGRCSRGAEVHERKAPQGTPSWTNRPR